MGIHVTRRDMSLENFLQEYSLPVKNVKELAPRWANDGQHRKAVQTPAALATYFEPALQRKECWEDSNRRKFIASLNNGLASLSTIIVCNVRESLDLAIAEDDELSIDYYQSILSKGFKYISLDGKNRTITLHRFADSLFTISGSFVNIDRISEKVDNQYFKNLSRELQHQFLKLTTIHVTELVGLKSNIFSLFVAIHEGMPLNHIEILNASPSPISAWVRDIADRHENAMKHFLKDDKINRMYDREWVAYTAMKYIRRYRPNSNGVAYPVNPDTNKTNLSAWYALGDSFRGLNDNGIPYIPAELDRVEKIIDESMRIFKAQKRYPASKTIARFMVNAVLMVVSEVLDNGNYIADHKKFFDELYDIEVKLSVASDGQLHADQQAAISNGTEMPSRSAYYSHWQTVPHQGKNRAKRKKALLAEVKNNVNRLTIR